MAINQEQLRMQEAREGRVAWRKWGPYLSERQWGTVREDYSSNGDAWGYLTHDQARSRAYRWGEDGIAGISDDEQQLCFALALWNGADPILKERLFGLTNSEGNHGEDVKEYYFYLDSTPTHSYMKYLYKYPQGTFPYADLLATNRARTRYDPEYELLDTHVFDEDRYFDVFVEYAKAGVEDILIRITVYNRGPAAAVLHVLPTLWFRNTWTWSADKVKPVLRQDAGSPDTVAALHPALGERYLYADGAAAFLFTENETNQERLFGVPSRSSYVKDGINDYIVAGKAQAVNPAAAGTKVAVHYPLEVGAGETVVLRLRLTETAPVAWMKLAANPIGPDFDASFEARRREADEFYRHLTPSALPADAAGVMRQALAGMLWSKQYYKYDVTRWLRGDPGEPPPVRAGMVRNSEWFHLVADDIISMPDKWEYPWFASWDLALQTYVLTLVDPDFAKEQVELLTRGWYLHPNGQLPAYEWSFSDANPPVHAWATWRVYLLDREARGQGDRQFLKRNFEKLLMNFTWWVNRKDTAGSNIFEGGFLGLDNIGVFDRSRPLPTGGSLEQADGTAWMALYCLDMLQIALELALEDNSYEELASKFYEHFMYIAAANADQLWDEDDGFYYDLLRRPDGSCVPLRVRSLVGLIPLCAVALLTSEMMDRLPAFMARMRWFNNQHPELTKNVHNWEEPGVAGRRLLSIFNQQRVAHVLARVLDENEFLSAHGIRSVSRYHKDHPYTYWVSGQAYQVDYEPAESTTGLFGGNSNWRGPVWMPINALIIEGLLVRYLYAGDQVKLECPTGSGNKMTSARDRR